MSKRSEDPGAMVGGNLAADRPMENQSDQFGTRPAADPAEIRAVPVRRPGRWFGTAIALVLLAMLINSLVTNPNYQWDVVGAFITEGTILDGLVMTLILTGLSMIIGLVLGILLAVMRGSANTLVAQISAAYIWFFRGTPVLVQLIFWFNLSALYPELGLGIPFGPQFVTFDANVLITPMMAGILGLGLNEAAYMAEIVRAGIVSIHRGQHEAAMSLGMTRMTTMRRIVLPQAMRVIIPPAGNNTIAMLKNVSLVSVLAIPELLYSAQIIYARSFQTIPLLIVASIWYLVCTTVLTSIQIRIERHYAVGSEIEEPFLSRLWQNITTFKRRLPASRTADREGK